MEQQPIDGGYDKMYKRVSKAIVILFQAILLLTDVSATTAPLPEKPPIDDLFVGPLGQLVAYSSFTRFVYRRPAEGVRWTKVFEVEYAPHRWFFATQGNDLLLLNSGGSDKKKYRSRDVGASWTIEEDRGDNSEIGGTSTTIRNPAVGEKLRAGKGGPIYRIGVDGKSIYKSIDQGNTWEDVDQSGIDW